MLFKEFNVEFNVNNITKAFDKFEKDHQVTEEFTQALNDLLNVLHDQIDDKMKLIEESEKNEE